MQASGSSVSRLATCAVQNLWPSCTRAAPGRVKCGAPKSGHSAAQNTCPLRSAPPTALRIKLFESMGELIQLPLSSEYGCFVPRWFLAPKARQRSLSVHGGEGPEKPQAFCHRGKSPSLEPGFETAGSLQQRGSTGCANPWRARHLVGGIAAQGDKIWNLGGIDAIPRANLGGADTRHLASADGIKDGGMVRGELERIAVAASNEDSAATLLF